ncbi:hypothetical protein GCM10007276_23200 [Agaricicola taiwanensis]|uniref:Sec-independent protein translocase protein TatB n=1 Tax=Agaricicola taiwanensis TaxID=591372 RepID=A0A8J2YIV7_9RHOB|nr:Sec-independent protein translocase protein TatB [Agaricicola taiwanensis]GGE45374.1 hypothetical protein GCM10007276_23200 [Agaricicola taiwanensis]
MFDIGWSELLIVAVVAIVVVGPKDLPDMLRNLGRGMRAIRRMASEFQGQFNEALKEAELDGVRDEFNRFRSSASDLTRFQDIPSIARDEIKGAIEGTPKADGPDALPAALPEPQLPVMQEPKIDVTPAPEPTSKRRAGVRPKRKTKAPEAAVAAADELEPAPPKPVRKRAPKPKKPAGDAS